MNIMNHLPFIRLYELSALMIFSLHILHFETNFYQTAFCSKNWSCLLFQFWCAILVSVSVLFLVRLVAVIVIFIYTSNRSVKCTPVYKLMQAQTCKNLIKLDYWRWRLPAELPNFCFRQHWWPRTHWRSTELREGPTWYMLHTDVSGNCVCRSRFLSTTMKSHTDCVSYWFSRDYLCSLFLYCLLDYLLCHIY